MTANCIGGGTDRTVVDSAAIPLTLERNESGDYETPPTCYECFTGAGVFADHTRSPQCPGYTVLVRGHLSADTNYLNVELLSYWEYWNESGVPDVYGYAQVQLYEP